MRMMGVDSVVYHEHTVAGRADDPVAAAAAYYASRGETPMVWGGSGRVRLGLEGEVDLADYRAVFGVDGARHPTTRARLVSCRRPGLELVVSPAKSVAELGVIGRAEDMHAIADAERDATLAFLDKMVAERGGRRGRAQIPTATSGLVWATSRHATTRAGDPQVHDHVLIANVLWMLDAHIGWKGLDTAFLRDHLHAATAVGRMAAAARAVELGYGIEADTGRSGCLGGFAIAGIPIEVCERHSTRAAQIDAAVGEDASPRARGMAARVTRDRKTHEDVGDLMARWQTELTSLGYSPAALVAAAYIAGAAYRAPVVDLPMLAGELLAPGGRLAGEKTFTRAGVIVAVAPHLHGLPVRVLDAAVEAVLARPDAVRLPAVTGAREAVWAAACVLADEHRIAALAETLTGRTAGRVDPMAALDAVGALADRLGHPLTATQHRVAVGLLTGGHSLDVVVGVAGSGKTTTLTAVRAGFETAGYAVIGTATSGQAAKNLTDGAGIESRTIASLSWRLDHATLTLTDRHVLICDEVGMTADVDLARLLGAVERAGAKLIVVGDDRQLDAIGPGGALSALTARHPEVVWTLSDNLRQTDPGEQAALAELRAGDPAAAVAWYVDHDRVHPAASRARAVQSMVRAWAADTARGADTVMLAYRRDNVDALNTAARRRWETAGLLSGPELTAPGGKRYRAGDRIITLAPGPRGAWVTSQPAQVTAVNPTTQQLTAVTADGQHLNMTGEDLGADRLAHGYAITAHRAQGATVDVAHVLKDGGGRELAYVAMSRARDASHIHLTAANQLQAGQRLAWAWDQQRRQQWVSDQTDLAANKTDLLAELDQLRQSIPADVSHELDRLRQQASRIDADLADLQTGSGRWTTDPAVARARHDLDTARRDQQRAAAGAGDPRLGLFARRRARHGEETAATVLIQADTRWRQALRPHVQRLAAQRSQLLYETAQVEASQSARIVYLDSHPDLVARINQIDETLAELAASTQRHRRGLAIRDSSLRLRRTPDVHLVDYHAHLVDQAAYPQERLSPVAHL
jgi:conjugative relaxase-like TrwC/TraI family protein